jgi:5-formyltetrahydrofolate cyclo-ligase
MTKNQTRKHIKNKKMQLDASLIDDASKQITSQLIDLKVFKEAAAIFLYAAFKDEVQTKYLHETAKGEGKKIAYPKITLGTGKMEFYSVSDLEELVNNNFKTMTIYEPNPKVHPLAIPVPKDIIIVPGLAFDLKGNRVGYGGGFYDRYLVKYPYLYKIGVCMDFQIIEGINTEDFDVRTNYIVSEKQGYLPFL